MSFDDDLVHSWLDCLRDNAWCSLHYESPALEGLGRGELSGGGYVRRRLTFSDPVAKTIWSTENVRFVGLNPNRLTYFGVWDHKQGGLIKAWGELPEDGVLIPQGGGYLLRAGSIAISID